MTIAAACLAALLAAQGADIATGLRLGPGYREGNPLLPTSLRGSAVVKASATAALALIGWRIRHQKPKLAIGLFIAGAASGALGAWHNTRMLSHTR